MSKLSVIIPSYMCNYVSRTIDDIFENAIEDVEVIVLLDGYSPEPSIAPRHNLLVVPKKERTGMRNSINLGVHLASGEFIMKSDDHCAFSKGFDVALKEHSEPHQVTIPSRYSLDPETWQRKLKDKKRWQIDYEYMTYPYVYNDKHRYGIGLYAKKWKGDHGEDAMNSGFDEFYKQELQRDHIKIDDIMIFHGSCYFMPREHFISIGGLSEKLFSTLYQEPQEISFKTWLSGGRVTVNKHAWYAHMHKGKDFGDAPNVRNYKLELTEMRETERFGTFLWMNNKWPGQTKKIDWLIDKFWPIAGWPEDWREQRELWNKKYPLKGERANEDSWNLGAWSGWRKHSYDV